MQEAQILFVHELRAYVHTYVWMVELVSSIVNVVICTLFK